MAISLNTNPTGQIARQNFSGNVFFLSASVRKLSSGLRINQSADDPVATLVGSQLEAQGRSLGQAVKNANDGIAAMQVVDNSLSTAMDMVGEILTKANAAAQAGLSDADRLALQSDIGKLLDEVDQVVASATYHDLSLLNGQYSNKALQLGTASGETLAFSLPPVSRYSSGQIHTAAMTITSPRGGGVDLRLTNPANGETIRVNGLTLAYANTANQGMGGLAAAINNYSAQTGISAQALVSVTSGSALTAGSTSSGFRINGVPIGSVAVLAGDSDGRLQLAINAKTSEHGVSAQVTADGRLSLSTADGRPIEVTGSGGGLGFSDAGMSTFGLTQVSQHGPYNLNLTDSAVGLAVAFSPTMPLAAPLVTSIDSTLTPDSVLAGGSSLAAGWTAGTELAGADLNGNIVTTAVSTLGQGSVLPIGSVIAAGSVLGGAVTLGAGVGTSAETILRSGSVLAAGSQLARGSYLTNDIVSSGGPLAAGQILTTDATLASDLTLSKDMMLLSSSQLASASSLAIGSSLGGAVTLTGALTVGSSGMTLASGSTIVDSDGVTKLAAGSAIGGPALLAGSNLTVTQGMQLTAGSTLAVNSELGLGSTIGGPATLAGTQTAGQDMYLEAGSQIAAGSTIAHGTVLSSDLMTTSGLIPAGSTTTADYQTIGLNTLAAAMTIRQGSILAAGSRLAATARNETPVLLGTESSLRLADINVLTVEGAREGRAIAQAAWSDLDSIRRQAAAVSDQLAGLATVRGGAKDMADYAKKQTMQVDFGDEAGTFTRMQMLVNTSSFALSQANAVPVNVLAIMQGGAETKATQFFIAALNRLITSGAVVN